MKKIIVLLSVALLLVACGKEQSEYEELLAKEFSKDQDVIDYKLDPETLAECVSDQIAGDVPAFSGSPAFESHFKGYKLFLRPEDPSEIPKRMKQTEDIFGSKKEANNARMQVISHTMFCLPQVREKQERSDKLFSFGGDE
jgi:hypothetical protein